MFRLIHLSDVHLGPMPPVRRRQLMSKRITGYVNWQRNRIATHQPEVLIRLLEDARSREADHMVVTGDLINLGLDAEIEAAREWLELLGTPSDVSVVCGNHDAYVPGALKRALTKWQPWCCGDDRQPVLGPEDYPVLRRRESISIIGCNSARASLPFLATGYFRGAQARRLAALLEEEGKRGQCRVVLIHHPPVRHAAPAHKRLNGQSLFRQVIARHGAELVLHGHTHVDSIHHIPGPERSVPVIGVPSGAQAAMEPVRRPAARYNLFEIERVDDRWAIRMEEFGYAGPGTGIVQISQAKML